MDLITLAEVTGNLNVFGYGFSVLAPALALGWMFGKAMESTARQPEMSNKINTQMYVAMAVIEVLGLLGFVAFIMVS